MARPTGPLVAVSSEWRKLVHDRLAERGMNQLELAKAIGSSQTTMSRMLRSNDPQPSVAMALFQKINGLLEISVAPAELSQPEREWLGLYHAMEHSLDAELLKEIVANIALKVHEVCSIGATVQKGRRQLENYKNVFGSPLNDRRRTPPAHTGHHIHRKK